MNYVRKCGFVFYPIDSRDDVKAKEWIFDRLEKLEKYPLADHYAFQRAESRRVT